MTRRMTENDIIISAYREQIASQKRAIEEAIAMIEDRWPNDDDAIDLLLILNEGIGKDDTAR